MNDKKGNRMSWRLIAGIIAITLILSIGAMASGVYIGMNLADGDFPRITNSVDTQPNGIEIPAEVLSVPEIAAFAGPSVVGVASTVETHGFFRSIGVSSGSGIILNEQGYIVTNQHVIDGAIEITVTLNTGAEFPATVVGEDVRSDLAVIKIDANEYLRPAQPGDSSLIQVGELAVAIGNPLGQEFAGTVTQGIISAVNRIITVQDRVFNLIQTDAAINSGNSGGALVNQFGQVIGINTIKIEGSGVEGMGFAIPISAAMPIIEDLIEYGYVRGRPIIGISVRGIDEATAQMHGLVAGVQVMEVWQNSGAYNAGILRSDIITKINNIPVQNINELNAVRDEYSAGDTVMLEVFRYATKRIESVNVILGEEL